MKKIISVMLCLALMLCAAALAEGAQDQAEYAAYPETEAYVGTWYAGTFIVTIAPSEAQDNTFTCVVSRYDEGDGGMRWTYEGCSYDDVGAALTSLEKGVKAAFTFDEAGEEVETETLWTDGAAAFKLNEDGTLTWTDYKEAPGENELVLEKVEDVEEGPEAAYEGSWLCDRAELTIESLDDVFYCTVTWASSASEQSVWEYEASYDTVAGELNTLETGVKTNLTYTDYGEDVQVSSEVEYIDGAAAFKLNEDGTLTWTDYKGTPGENELVFERNPENAVLVEGE